MDGRTAHCALRGSRRFRPRGLLALAVAAALVAVAAAPGISPAALSTNPLHATDHRPATNTKLPASRSRATDKRVALRALRRARSLMRGAGVRTGRELTPVLRQLALSLPALSGDDLRAARRLLARPTDGFLDPAEHGYAVGEAPPLCSPHFCVHYVTSTADAVNPASNDGDAMPDQVQQTGSLLESIWGQVIGQMGWREPRSDLLATNDGGNGRVDVYLSQIGDEGIYGYAAPDVQTPIGNTVYGYLVLDNDYSPAEYRYDDPFKPRAVTSAHEFNHLSQFAYDVLQDLWMQEATATWFEEVVFPAIDDYLQYIGPWATSTLTPITAPVPEKVYGDVLWSMWLAGRFGPGTIERSWANSLDTVPPDLAALAYDRAITAFGGLGIADEFGRFTAAVAETQAAGSPFPDALRFGDVTRVGALRVDGGPIETELAHASFALLDVSDYHGSKVITLQAEFPIGTAASIALVGRMPDGSAQVQQKTDALGGRMRVSFSEPAGAGRMTAVVTNADFEVEGYSSARGDWVYAKDGQETSAEVIGHAPYPLVFLGSPSKQKVRTVTRKGLLVAAWPDDEIPTRLSIQLDIASRYLKGSTIVGRAGIFLPAGSKKRVFRVRLSAAARRALARRSSTKVLVKAKFTEPTGTATQRENEAIRVVR